MTKKNLITHDTNGAKPAGGEGDIALAAGKTCNFGFAIHDDCAGRGRIHNC